VCDGEEIWKGNGLEPREGEKIEKGKERKKRKRKREIGREGEGERKEKEKEKEKKGGTGWPCPTSPFSFLLLIQKDKISLKPTTRWHMALDMILFYFKTFISYKLLSNPTSF